MDFKVGDLVQLKSGGPVMTVEYLDEYGAAGCIWFNETETSSTIGEYRFPMGTLELAPSLDFSEKIK